MLVTKPYDRLHALKYAQKWALERNPLFYDFADIGGDCTNFVSQCLRRKLCDELYAHLRMVFSLD